MSKKTKKLKTEVRPPIHEVLNTDAVIAWFDDFLGDHDDAVLSNFYKGAPIVLPCTWETMWPDSVDWLAEQGIDADELIEADTGEALFAAFKCAYVDDFLAVLRAENKQGVRDPGKAKELGRKVELREDWEEIKYDVMMLVLRYKFTLTRLEGMRLLETGDRLLVEGTLWGDRVWGVDLDDRESDPLTSYGRNWLGTLLMARRAELRAEQAFGVTSRAAISNLAKTF